MGLTATLSHVFVINDYAQNPETIQKDYFIPHCINYLQPNAIYALSQPALKIDGQQLNNKRITIF